MFSYKQFHVGYPLAYVFQQVGLNKISYVISFSAVIATASVLLVFQMGQPRIWMSMSRDGLLPKAFSRIHPKYKTPSFSTVVTGFVVAVPALFLNLTEVTGRTSIGTLFAFVLVCGGVLLLPEREAGEAKPKFKIPYMSSQFIVPVLFIVGVIIFWKNFIGLFDFSMGWEVFRDKLPFFLFVILATALAIVSFIKKLSLIPTLGLASCFYLMTELGYTNWMRFLIWLVIGLVIFFLYSRHHSKLNEKQII